MMKRVALIWLLLTLGAASCSSSKPAMGPPVPGTFADVNGHHFEPLHVGEVLGQVPKESGGCKADSVGTGTTSEGGDHPPAVEIQYDGDCRITVTKIELNPKDEGPPSGGVFVPASQAT